MAHQKHAKYQPRQRHEQLLADRRAKRGRQPVHRNALPRRSPITPRPFAGLRANSSKVELNRKIGMQQDPRQFYPVAGSNPGNFRRVTRRHPRSVGSPKLAKELGGLIARPGVPALTGKWRKLAPCWRKAATANADLSPVALCPVFTQAAKT
jgi:hypothetical protein